MNIKKNNKSDAIYSNSFKQFDQKNYIYKSNKSLYLNNTITTKLLSTGPVKNY